LTVPHASGQAAFYGTTDHTGITFI